MLKQPFKWARTFSLQNEVDRCQEVQDSGACRIDHDEGMTPSDHRRPSFVSSRQRNLPRFGLVRRVEADNAGAVHRRSMESTPL